MKPRRSLQSPGVHSKVYVPIIRHLFEERYTEGADYIEFTLDDVRATARLLKIEARNAADVIYRMRSRTVLPEEITQKGFFVLRPIDRGKYRLEKASSTLVELPDNQVQDALDITPLPVRRLLPLDLAKIDEQGLLTIVNYCKILDHFSGLQVYRLRSHVRKSVEGIGQAELDEIDVGVALRDDEIPIVFPIEAKAADEPVNRVQIVGLVVFAEQYFPKMVIRPLVLKVDYNALVHVLEFNVTRNPTDLQIVKSATYSIQVSEAQKKLIAETEAVRL